MARTALTVQNVVATGLKATYTAGDATNEHQFLNTNGDTVLHVKNGGASPCVVTIQTPATVQGLAVAEQGGTVPAGEDWFFGPFPVELFNQAGALVYVDLDQASSVTLAALRLPR